MYWKVMGYRDLSDHSVDFKGQIERFTILKFLFINFFFFFFEKWQKICSLGLILLSEGTANLL